MSASSRTGGLARVRLTAVAASRMRTTIAALLLAALFAILSTPCVALAAGNVSASVERLAAKAVDFATGERRDGVADAPVATEADDAPVSSAQPLSSKLPLLGNLRRMPSSPLVPQASDPVGADPIVAAYNSGVDLGISGGGSTGALVGSGTLTFLRASQFLDEDYHYTVSYEGVLYTMQAERIYTDFVNDAYASERAVPWGRERSKLNYVIFNTELSPQSTAFWFKGFTELRTVAGAQNLWTDRLANTTSMFDGCASLGQVEGFAGGNFEAPVLTDASRMFAGCASLTGVALSNWQVPRLLDASSLFEGCTSLTSVDASYWNAERLLDASRLFAGCTMLASVRMQGWQAPALEDVSHLLDGCSALESVELLAWQAGALKTVDGLLAGCPQLETADLSGLATTGVTSGTDLGIDGCASLVRVTVGEGWHQGNASSATHFPAGKSWADASGTQLTSAQDYSTANVAIPDGAGVYQPITLVISVSSYEQIAAGTASSVAYALTLTNEGSRPAVGISVQSALSGYADVSAADGGSVSDGVATWSVARLAAGEQVTLTASGTTAANIAAGTELSASVTAYAFDTEGVALPPVSFSHLGPSVLPANEVAGAAELSITMVGPETVAQGGSPTYLITLVNKGNLPATVDLDDNLPEKTRYESASVTLNGRDVSGGISGSGRSFGWSGVVPAGMEATISLTLTLDSTAAVGETLSHAATASYAPRQGDTPTSVTSDQVTTLVVTEGSDGVYAVFDATNGFLTFLRSAGLTAGDTYTVEVGGTSHNLTVHEGAYWTGFVDLAGDYLISDNVKWYAHREDVKKVIIRDEIAPASLRGWFYSFTNLTELVGWEHLDPSRITSCSYAFYRCTQLASVDLSGWATPRLTTCYRMFLECESLSSVWLAGWNTSAVTDMRGMFQSCTALTWAGMPGIEQLDVGSVTLFGRQGNTGALNNQTSSGCDGMFARCVSLERADLSGWNLASTACMGGMFIGCAELASVSLPDAPVLNDACVMFALCPKLTSVDLSGWKTPKLERVYGMFCKCEQLSEVDLSGWDTHAVTDMQALFHSCASLRWAGIRGISTLDTSSVRTFGGYYDRSSIGRAGFNDTGALDCGMFAFCTSLESADLSSWNMSASTSLACMFSGCTQLARFTHSTALSYAGLTDVAGMFYGCESLPSMDVHGWSTPALTTTYALFYGCGSLADVDLTGWDTSAVSDMRRMFGWCTSLTWARSRGLNTLDVSSVATFGGDYSEYSAFIATDDAYMTDNEYNNFTYGMFMRCSSLETADLTAWDMGSATSTAGMFSRCTSLASVALNDVSSQNLACASAMFAACEALTSANLSNWQVPQLTDTRYQFWGTGLAATDFLASWPCPSVAHADHMFQACPQLETARISAWDVPSLRTCDYLFQGCAKLASVDLDGWNTPELTTARHMLSECVALPSIELFGWAAPSLRDVTSLLDGCDALERVSMSGWSTPALEVCQAMCRRCVSLTSVDLRDWDTSAVWDLRAFFAGCSSIEWEGLVGIEQLDLHSARLLGREGWSQDELDRWESDEASDVDLRLGMFARCSSLTHADLSHWDWSSAEYATCLFLGCTSLSEVVLPSSAPALRSLAGAFAHCRSLGAIDFATMSVPHLENLSFACYDCEHLSEVRVDGWRTPTLATVDSLFYGCKALEVVDISTWSAPELKDADSMFCECTLLTDVTMAGWDTPKLETAVSMFEACNGLVSTDFVNGWYVPQLADMRRMFASCTGLTGSALSGLAVPALRDASSLFEDCTALASVDLGGWFTPELLSCNAMFRGCSSLTSATLTRWDTSSVEDMRAMFAGCSSIDWDGLVGIEELDVGSVRYLGNDFVDIYELRDEIRYWQSEDEYDAAMRFGMFARCSSLSRADLSRWDLSSAEYATCLFLGCTSLSEIKLPTAAPALRSLAGSFAHCQALVGVDLSQMAAPQLEYASYLFTGCSRLLFITVGDDWEQNIPSGVWRATFPSNYWFEYDVSTATTLATNRAYTISGEVPVAHAATYVYNAAQRMSERGAYAIFCEDDSSLTFLTPAALHAGGYTKRITQLYSGFDLIDYGTAVDSYDQPLMVPWADRRATVLSVDAVDLVKPIQPHYMARWFEEFSAVTLPAIEGVSRIDSSKAESLHRTFAQCTSLESFDGSLLDVSSAADLSELFSGCSAMTTATLSSFDLLQATDVRGMFASCAALASIDLSTWYAPKLTSVVGMLEGCSGLRSANLGAWQMPALVHVSTDEVGIVKSLFKDCAQLADVEMSNWYAPAVTSLASLFSGKSNLEAVRLHAAQTPALRDLSRMFYNCSNLITVDLSEWDTHAVTDMQLTFGGCRSLPTDGLIGLSALDVSSVRLFGSDGSTTGTFYNCDSLIRLDLSAWDVRSATDLSLMFYHCDNLVEVTIKDWNASSLTSVRGMFNQCKSLEWVDLSGWNTPRLTSTAFMFNNNCASLRYINMADWNTEHVSTMAGMYNGCPNLYFLKVGANWGSNIGDNYLFYPYFPGGRRAFWYEFDDVSGEVASTMTGVGDETVVPADKNHNQAYIRSSAATTTPYGGCAVWSESDASLTFLTPMALFVERRYTKPMTAIYSGFDVTEPTTEELVPWYDVRERISSAEVLDEGERHLAIRSLRYLLCGARRLIQVDGLARFDTSGTTSMAEAFRGCAALSSIDLAGLRVTGVTSMQEAFADCSSLQVIDLSGVTTGPALTTLEAAFRGCTSLQVASLANLQTSGVTTMAQLFQGCTSLMVVDLMNLDTSSVTTMEGMFANDDALQQVTIGQGFTQTGITDTSLLAILPAGDWYDTISKEQVTDNIVSEAVDIMRVLVRGRAKIYALWCAADRSLNLIYNAFVPAAGTIYAGNGQIVTAVYSVESDEVFDSAAEVPWLADTTTDVRTNVLTVNIANELPPESVAYWFANCTRLANVNGLELLRSGEVRNYAHLFDGCVSLSELDLTPLDTRAAQDLRGMVDNCSGLYRLSVGELFDQSGAQGNAACFPTVADGRQWRREADGLHFLGGTTVPDGAGVYELSAATHTISVTAPATGIVCAVDTTTGELEQELPADISNIGETSVSVTGWDLTDKGDFTGVSEAQWIPGSSSNAEEPWAWWWLKVRPHPNRAVPSRVLSASHEDTIYPFGDAGDDVDPSWTADPGAQIDLIVDEGRVDPRLPLWEVGEGERLEENVGTVTWHLSATECTVNFVTNGGPAAAAQTVSLGERIQVPANYVEGAHPVKLSELNETTDFVGWFVDRQLTTEWDFTERVTHSMVLYAGWDEPCQVTYDTNGGVWTDAGELVRPVARGAKAPLPSTPTYGSLVFKGWYADEELTDRWDFATRVVTSDLTLHARWGDYADITFETLGGTAIEPQRVRYGDTVRQPDDPTLSGSSFGGWYVDAAYTEPWDFATPVTCDLVLYARWGDLLTVSFETFGGSAVDNQYVLVGDAIRWPVTPTRAGSIFTGWYFDEALTQAYRFGAPIEQDTRLYARWLVTTSYDLNCLDSSGDPVTLGTPSPQTVVRGSLLTRPDDPTRTGYLLTGWYTEPECVNAWDFATPVDVAQTLYAGWAEARTITWYAEDGQTVLATSTVAQGSRPSYGGLTPTKPSTTTISYLFDGWKGLDEVVYPADELPVATQDTSYAAHFAQGPRRYRVIFMNGSSSIYDTALEYGSTPVYDGEPPARAANAQYAYEFDGWAIIRGGRLMYGKDVQLPVVTNDVVYYAHFAPVSRSYDVTFDLNDATGRAQGQPEAQRVVYGQKATEPAAPTLEGMAFCGWYSDIGLTERFSFTFAILGDVELHARWAIPHTVHFIDDDATTLLADVIVGEGDRPVYPGAAPTPTKAATVEWEYSFAGWATSTDEGATVYDGELPELGTEDVSYYAAYSARPRVYTVTFMDGDGSTVLATQRVAYGSTASDPQVSKNGATLINWYGDPEHTAIHDFVTPVTGDLVLYSDWKVDEYLVTFLDEAEQETLKSGNVAHGLRPVAPEDPSKDDTASTKFTFAGWKVRGADGSLGEAIYTSDLLLPTRENMTYVAAFKSEPREYTITYLSEDGATILRQSKVAYGSRPDDSAIRPASHEDSEYVHAFVGWTSGANGAGTTYETLPTVTGDASYYAHWASDRKTAAHTVTLNPNGGSFVSGGADPIRIEGVGVTLAWPIEQHEMTFGQKLFAGWASSATGDVIYRAGDTMPVVRDVELFAVWEDLSMSLTFSQYDDGAVRYIDAQMQQSLRKTGVKRVGILYGATLGQSYSDTDLVINANEGTGVVDIGTVATGAEAPAGQDFKRSMLTPEEEQLTFTARGYILFTGGDGKSYVAYTDLLSRTYAELADGVTARAELMRMEEVGQGSGSSGGLSTQALDEGDEDVQPDMTPSDQAQASDDESVPAITQEDAALPRTSEPGLITYTTQLGQPSGAEDETRG